MFFIIGGDGKEYGPVSAEQVDAWVKAGRASFESTQARREGEEQLRPLREFPEFNGALPPPIAPTEPLASRGVRFGSNFIDGLIATLFTSPALVYYFRHVMSLAANAGRNGQFDPQSMTPALNIIFTFYGYWAICICFYWIVQGWIISTRGQSIGKRLVGIRIVKLPENTRPGFVHGFLLRSLLPFFISLIPFLGMVFWLVDVCFIFGDEKRCLHDRIASTKVINGQPPAE